MVQSFATTPDGLTWTFVLRDDLKFHDGAAVTAADVVASLKRWGQLDGLGQQLTAHTASLEAVDARTVKLTLRMLGTGAGSARQAELHGAIHHARADCQNADERGGKGSDRLRPVHDEA